MNALANPSHFPRGALLGAGAVLALAIFVAGVGRIHGPEATQPVSQPVLSRDFRFEDRTDGGVTVIDARNGGQVAIVAPGTNGFLRATLRGLTRARIHQDIGDQTPFRLTEWADGRLTLEDPTTSRHVELAAFGITNAEAFAQLLTAEATPQAATRTGTAKP